ncbi:MAG: hypothetical protein ACSLFO_07020 [Acidimicrobiales bacterium]
MTIMVLLALAAIWTAVLVPPYLQKRRATHPSSSVVDFNQQLAVLQRTGRALDGAPFQEGYAPRTQPHAATHAPIGRSCLTRTDVLRRRRDVVVTLASAAALTFLLAVALGGNVWLLHLLADAAFLGYVALLLHIKGSRRLPVQGANVRYLQQSRPSSTQQALLRRSAN